MVARTLLLAFALLLLAGCSTQVVTNPPRSAIEELLLSTAADRAVNLAMMSDFASKKVFIDSAYFESYDSKYALGEIRDAFSRAGALLATSATNCDIVVEPRSGALSIDSSTSLIGIPQTGMPVPLAGAVSLPEVAFYKSSRQHSWAKFDLLAYSAQSRDHIYSSGPMLGRSYNIDHRLIGIFHWVSTDIPERQKKKKK